VVAHRIMERVAAIKATEEATKVAQDAIANRRDALKSDSSANIAALPKFGGSRPKAAQAHEVRDRASGSGGKGRLRCNWQKGCFRELQRWLQWRILIAPGRIALRAIQCVKQRPVSRIGRPGPACADIWRGLTRPARTTTPSENQKNPSLCTVVPLHRYPREI
jgi:hypothetical protein